MVDLVKQPETEAEYWQIIHTLGGSIWRANHNLADGRVEDSIGTAVAIISAQEFQAKLFTDLEEKFGVIPPQNSPAIKLGQELPPAPEGKIYFNDWFKEQRRLALTADFEALICSACPFSGSVETYISCSLIPCTVFHGSLSDLERPDYCAMVEARDWSHDQLHANIREQHGEEALEKFKQKEAALQVASTSPSPV